MTVAPDWNGVEVRWKGRLLNGAIPKGQLIFTASQTRFVDDDPTSATLILGRPITVKIREDGTASTVLPATDDPDISSTPFTYTCKEDIEGGGGGTFTFEAPMSAAASGIDLVKLSPVLSGPGTPVSLVTREEFDNLTRVVLLEPGASVDPTTTPVGAIILEKSA